MYAKDKQAVVDGLRLDPGPHKYTYQGVIIPSVTQTIEHLLPYDGLPKDIRESALQRGDIVHKLTDVLDTRGDYMPYWADVQEAGVEGYLQAWQSFKQAVRPVIIASEKRIFHTKYRYCGTFDRVAQINGRLTLIEIKTGSLVPEYALQTAAYVEAYNEKLLDQTRQLQDRIVVLLRENGSYQVEPHTDKTDFGAFVAALTIANWRRTHGRY